MKRREPEDEQLCIAVHKIHTHTYAVNLPLDIPDRITIALATFHFQPIKKSITASRALPYITWGLVQDSKTKNKGIPMFLLNIFIVYEKLKILCVNI